MLSELRSNRPVNDANLLVEANVIEILHHHAGVKLPEVAAVLGRRTPAPLPGRLGELRRIVRDLGLDLQELHPRLGLRELTWPEQYVRRGRLLPPVVVDRREGVDEVVVPSIEVRPTDGGSVGLRRGEGGAAPDDEDGG